MANGTHDKADYGSLHELGFSKTAVLCYENLIRQGGTDIGQLMTRLQRPRASVYRSLKQLERRGFVTSLKTPIFSTRYTAVKIDKAIENLAVYHCKQVKHLIEEQAETSIKRRLSGPLY